MLKKQISKGYLFWSILSVIALLCFLGTVGQLMTHLNGHPAYFAGWWLVKMAVSALVVIVPILIGTGQRYPKRRLGMAVCLWLLGALGFIWAKYTTQPILSTSQPSPELYVGQEVFIAWLVGTGLFIFARPLQQLLHRWSIDHRRHWLIAITVAFFVIRLFNGYDLLGFHRGTSLVWFVYLFAAGDWLANDREWLKKWPSWLYGLLTVAMFCLSGIMTWLNMSRIIYSPHRGFTPNYHYLLAINAYQPVVIITCLLAFAWAIRGTKGQWANDHNIVQGILLLGLLGTPQAVTPIMVPTVKWPLVVALAIILAVLLLGLPGVITRIDWAIDTNWRGLLIWGKQFAKRFWPVLLTYAILWLITVASFAILWNNDLTMVQWVVTQRAKIVTVNVLIIFAIVLLLMALTNRWWLSSGIGIVFYLGWLVASVLKIAARNEPILPTDVSTVTAPGELLGMVNPWVLVGALLGIVLLIVIFAWVEHRYGKPTRFSVWARIIVAVLAVLFLASFTRANHSKSIVFKQLQRLDDTPYFYSQIRGARMNGTLLQFANNVDVHVMTEPAGYTKSRMDQIERRYAQAGVKINQQRTHQNVGKQNLVFVLSESFADPRRVPGMKVSGGDPLPFLHQFKQHTTSGLMISSGYGGGTANMEYQALTGLSIANFSPTMPTPYSQLVPYQQRTFTINRLFHYAIGIHPFTANLYSRKTVYKKFGFKKFYHFDGGNKITYKSKIQNNPRVSDDSTYKEIDLNIHRQPHGKFIQVATMQNHMPYRPEYYHKRQYHVSGRGFKNADQQGQIEAYIQGIHYTDQALDGWIHRVDEMKQPTTIVWYGDHLPGIYHGLPMSKYGIPLHETDYFIYSNKAARRMNTDRLTAQHKIVGPNDFSAMALAKMDVKVSPYYALLTEVEEDLPAISLPTNGTAKNNTAHQSGISFVNQRGQHTKLNAKQRKLFDDYRLVQYDLTAGHHYLLKDSFLKQVAK